jgi:type II secretory pathway pseudopilin PulG
MAAVLVAIALMSIVMTALLPAWRQQVQREKEAELAFRGEQYARAILLFRRKFNGASPMTIEALVDGRFLRKKFKDPMTGEDFQPLYIGQQPGQQGPQGQPGRGGPAGPPGRGGPAGAQPGRGGPVGQPQGGGVGITGVISKSKENSIRIYRGASTYNAWQFVDPIGNRRGGPGGNPGQPGAPGQGGRNPGTGPGGPRGGGIGPGGSRGGAPPPPGRGRGPGVPPGGGRGPIR